MGADGLPLGWKSATESFTIAAGVLLTALQQPDGDWGDLDFGTAFCSDSSKYSSMKLPAGQGKLKDTLSVSGVSMRGWGKATHLWDQNPSIMGWSCGGLMANTGDFAKFFYDLL